MLGEDSPNRGGSVVQAWRHQNATALPMRYGEVEIESQRHSGRLEPDQENFVKFKSFYFIQMAVQNHKRVWGMRAMKFV